MSFGGGPFGISPFGTAPVVFAEQPVPDLHSSAKLDGITKTWVLDDTTNAYEGMDDVHQRIILLLAYNVVEPELIGEDYPSEFSQQVRDALKVLTEGRNPLIRLDKIEVIQGVNGTIYKRIVFTKLLTGTQQSIRSTG